MVGVDVVDVEFRLFGLWGAGRGQNLDFELGAFGESGDCRAAVAAEVGRRRNSLAERFLQAGGVEAGEDGVEGGAAAVASHHDPNLLVREAALGGLAAAATGGPGQTAPATLEGLEDKGLIGFDDPRKALGLVVIERGEKSMSPPEGGARVDLASLGRLGEALPLDEGSPLIEPAVLVVQAGDWRCCERIEGLATLSAAVARQAPRAAPPSNLGAAAVRAAVSGEADFGDVRQRRAPARRRGSFRASPSRSTAAPKPSRFPLAKRRPPPRARAFEMRDHAAPPSATPGPKATLRSSSAPWSPPSTKSRSRGPSQTQHDLQ